MAWTDEQMAIYRTSAQKRQQQKRDRLQQRQRLGLIVAQQASELLKRDFQAEKVVLFGSMRFALSAAEQSPDRIHERSDVDLAVWGLNPQDYFQAVGQLLALHPDISVDLVEVETASPRLRQAIETTGVIL